MSISPIENNSLKWASEPKNDAHFQSRHEQVLTRMKTEVLKGRYQHDVLVVGSYDFRAEEAKALEVKALESLGDPPEEVISEFLVYNGISFYFLAFEPGAEETPENIQGMMRIIPHVDGYKQKSLTDLAYLLDKKQKNITGEGISGPSTIELFMLQSGCRDMTKVWDISTFAPRIELPQTQKGAVLVSLVTALTSYGLDAYRNGELEYCVVFNDENFHRIATESLHFPYKLIRDEAGKEIGSMMYDTFDSGVGMVAVPAYLDMKDVLKMTNDRSQGMKIGQVVLAN